jgi:DNA-binding response OmpR family regulator
MNHILVIDDEPELREMLVDALADTDMQVYAAASGNEAVALAKCHKPDLVITDLCLGGENGLEVVDRLRGQFSCDLPAVVITGRGDVADFSEASRRRPVELMLKPLDVTRLRATVRSELSRHHSTDRLVHRSRRLRRLAREVNRQRRLIRHQLDDVQQDLRHTNRELSGQLELQQAVMNFQQQLIGARSDDDVFRILFRTFVQRSGGLHGVALVCDDQGQLRIVGRFGTPQPDSLAFCQSLAEPVVGMMIASPRVELLDAWEQQELFAENIRRYLVGVSVLAVPLIPQPGQLIAMAVLYRKGEQPFVHDDVRLAEEVAHAAALAVERID